MAKKAGNRRSESALRVSIPERDSLGNFTWEKKIDVATKYMALGNMRLVGEICNVPYQTLFSWKKQDWWAELIEEIRKTRRAETNTKLSKIVDKSLSVIEDRLDHGDFIMNLKTGELERKPVSMKDANTVTKDLLSHQARVEEMTQKMETTKETVQDQLKLLANEFAKWSRKLGNQDAITTGFKEIASAVHDEREEGLQEGGGEIYEPSLSNQETEFAEQGTPNP